MQFTVNIAPNNTYENLMLPYIQTVIFSKLFSLNSVIIFSVSSISISTIHEADCLVHDHLLI